MLLENPPPALVARLAAAWPADTWSDVTVLAAVSGGADSVALVHGLVQLRIPGDGRLVVAHYNHRLRGAESDADQSFVGVLAKRLGLELITDSSPSLPLSPSPPLASESALRDERYAFLRRAANQCGARYVATAHTADDQVETVLMNMLRGTGLAGLAGIPRVRALYEGVALVRPLLDATRHEVLEYLSDQGLTHREDATNASRDYTRNRIRHELLPLLAREYNPEVRAAIQRLSRLAAEADDLVFSQVRLLLSKIKRLRPDGVELQTQPLRRASDLIARAALLQAWKWQGWPLADMTFERWEELLAFARQPPATSGADAASRMLPGGIRAQREGDVLRLTRPA
jgi:tRNA(Ile)-lysidine synthase